MSTMAPTAAGHRATARPARAERGSASRRTMLVLIACALSAVPIKGLLSDSRWLVDAWAAMAVVLIPAALLRRWHAPTPLDVWPGIILLIPWLTHMYVPAHAWAGLVPSRATFDDISTLMDSLHRTTTDGVAPVHSTVAIRLVVAALLGLLAALIDLLAVVGQRAALAGIPLLVIFTVSGAVPRTPVPWFWFTPAAAGYLILLELGAGDRLRSWGRRIARPGAGPTKSVPAFSGYRIGVAAILTALVLPALVPAHPANLIADAFHHHASDSGGFGAGNGGGAISPFAALKGQLNRGKPTPLMSVRITAKTPVQPFYLRTNVLDRFTGSGWIASGHGNLEPVGQTVYSVEPPAADGARTTTYDATIKITGLTGNAPVLNVPTSVQGVDAGTLWSPRDQVLVGADVHRDLQFIESVAQPEPTVAALDAAPPATDAAIAPWLALSAPPAYVTTLVANITKGAHTPYSRARAISDWFADPANGFVYSTRTTKGDSGNDLVDFLQQRTGFCQQFAAAMGVMLRQVGVPARIVLGYMHPSPDRNGTFVVTTAQAHAWVEAFFPGVGWIPFDPTPPAGLTGGRSTDLSWAPHVYASNAVDVPTRTNQRAQGQRSSAASVRNRGAASSQSTQSSSGAVLMWGAVTLAMLGALGLVPAAVRLMRRRRRMALARLGDPSALWAELTDTAVDLGYVWSPARTPRQVSAWLSRDAAASAPALQALADAVERRRYAPDPGAVDTRDLGRGLVEVTGELRSRRTGATRVRARLWPASLGWRSPVPGARRLLRRRH